MKLRMIDRVLVCEPWKNIQGKEMCVLDEFLANNSSMEKKQAPLLSASLVLDVFQQLAMWLILYSSEFQQTGTLCQVAQFNLVKWREISDWIHLTLDVTSQKNHSVFFKGHALTEGRLVAWVDGLELAIEPISNPENAKEYEYLWKCFRIPHPLGKKS